MNRRLRLLLSLVLVVTTAGCFVVDARQTLRHLDDGTTLVAEGRREVCLRLVDDASGEVVADECDIVENALEMSEYVIFDRPGGSLLVGVAPVDVTEVVVTVAGREVVTEKIESDLTTGFYIADLPAEAASATVVGLTEAGGPVGDPVEIDLAG